MAGGTRVKVRVHGPKGYADVEMIADAGATLTTIPEGVARAAGLVQTGSAAVKLADGTRKNVAIAQAEVEIRGDRAPVRVLIGSDDQVPLLGLTSLETLGLKVNPVERRLEPSEYTLYALTRNLEQPCSSLPRWHPA
jgi:predicted aspartyl protease